MVGFKPRRDLGYGRKKGVLHGGTDAALRATLETFRDLAETDEAAALEAARRAYRAVSANKNQTKGD